MNLQICGINEFSARTEGKNILCFGASENLYNLLRYYPEYRLAKRITAIADNDPNKCGTLFHTRFNEFPVISAAQLVRKYVEDKTAVLLILPTLFSGAILQQLNAISELDDMDCYIYDLFPYCDHFRDLPDELIRLREGKQRIPKAIHYCWFGGNPMPEKNKGFIESWKKFCPDYEIHIWNEENYDIGKHPYMKAAYEKKKYSFVSDYARLDIIYRHGGIYVDTDVEMLKSFDDLLYGEAFFGLTLHEVVNSGNGFGAAAGSTVVREMRDIYDGVVFANDGTKGSSSAFLETEALRHRGYIGGNRFFIHKDAVVYPVEFFSPKSTIFGIPNITDNCYSIHHFDYSWSDPALLAQKQATQAIFSPYLKNRG